MNFTQISYQLVPFGFPLYDECLALRNDILRKPLNLEFNVEDIQNEWNQICCAVFTNADLIGVTLLEPHDEYIKMRQFAIQSSSQGLGIGSKLLAFAERTANNMMYSVIRLHARETATQFYEKNGYHKIGDSFIEVGLPHFIMEKKIL